MNQDTPQKIVDDIIQACRNDELGEGMGLTGNEATRIQALIDANPLVAEFADVARLLLKGAEEEGWAWYRGTDESRTGIAELRSVLAKLPKE